MNTGGSPLTDQEIRNCIFRGLSDSHFFSKLKSLANNNKYLDLVSLSQKQLSEKYNEELILRFFSLYDNIDNTQSIKGNMSKHMDHYMKETVEKDSFNSNLDTLFLRIIDVLSPLGGSIFRFKNNIFSTSLFDAITLGVGLNISYYEDKDKEELLKIIDDLKTDDDFRKYTGSASSSKSRVVNRIKIAKDRFRVD